MSGIQASDDGLGLAPYLFIAIRRECQDANDYAGRILCCLRDKELIVIERGANHYTGRILCYLRDKELD